MKISFFSKLFLSCVRSSNRAGRTCDVIVTEHQTRANVWLVTHPNINLRLEFEGNNVKLNEKILLVHAATNRCLSVNEEVSHRFVVFLSQETKNNRCCFSCDFQIAVRPWIRIDLRTIYGQFSFIQTADSLVDWNSVNLLKNKQTNKTNNKNKLWTNRLFLFDRLFRVSFYSWKK